MTQPIDSTTQKALAYSDLQTVMPWIKDHTDALKQPTLIELPLLDVLILDLSLSAATHWALDFDMPSVISRMASTQDMLRNLMIARGLPYRANSTPA